MKVSLEKPTTYLENEKRISPIEIRIRLEKITDDDIELFGFFTVSGNFGFEKSTDSVTLGDTSTVNVDKLTIGASNVTAFAGVNGGTADELGLSLSGVEFGLAFLTARAAKSVPFSIFTVARPHFNIASDNRFREKNPSNP